MRVNCLSYHFSSLQEYCGQVLLVRFYRLGKPESENQVPCRVMSKIESYTSLCFSCFLNTWKDACSQNKDMCLLLQSPHSPHVPQCLPIQNFLGVFVEVNRTFSFLERKTIKSQEYGIRLFTWFSEKQKAVELEPR